MPPTSRHPIITTPFPHPQVILLTNAGRHSLNLHRAAEAKERALAALKLDAVYTPAWALLCDAMQRLGGPDEGEACGIVGVRRGVWERPDQRPAKFEPGLEASKPWPDAATYPAIHAALAPLTAAWEAIRGEALGMLALAGAGGLAFGTMEGLEERPDDEDRGRWHSRPLRCWEAPAEAPATCAALLEVNELLLAAVGEDASGQRKLLYTAQFLRLEPGGHIRPHCGAGNFRWVAHLGLLVPEGVSITVGGEQRSWTEGGTILFDDSFIHEVLHTGTMLL